MRATTGGSADRSACARRVAGAPPMATAKDGCVSSGSDPPPTVERTSIVSAGIPAALSAAAMACARAAIALGAAAIIRQTGSSVSAFPSR